MRAAEVHRRSEGRHVAGTLVRVTGAAQAPVAGAGGRGA
jgi:hypothetical protein